MVFMFLFLVYVVHISLLCLGSSINVYSCLTWLIKENKFELICRVDELIYPIYFADTDDKIVGICLQQKQRCRFNLDNGKIETNFKTNEVKLTIEDIHQKYINGNWTCVNGGNISKTEVSTTKGIASSTDIFIKGDLLQTSNQVKISCFSCRQPYRNTVEFLVDHVSKDSITFNKIQETCFNGRGVSHPDKFTCDPTGTTFVHIFEIYNKSTGTHFSCEMRFVDQALSSRFRKKTTLYFDGKRFHYNGSLLEITKPADLPIIDINLKDVNKSVSTIPKRKNIDDSTDNSEAGQHHFWIIGMVLTVLVVIVFGIGTYCWVKHRKTGKRQKGIEAETELSAAIGKRKSDSEGVDSESRLSLLHEQAENRLHREKELKPAVNYTICNPCNSRCRELSTKATMWCFDCVEAFCNACIEYHSSMKITNTHYVVDIHKLPENYDAPFLCSTHNRSKCEYFCVSHKMVCCTKCADEKHNMCNNLNSIDLYFHKCKNKQMESACKERLEIIEKLKERYENKIKVIENDENKTHGLIPDIDQHKRRDNVLSSDNENETIGDEERLVSIVKKSRRKSISDLDRKIAALDIFRKTITEQYNLLKLTLDIGSRKHSFLVIYYLESLFEEFDRKIGLHHDKNVNDLFESYGNRNFITNSPERFVFRDKRIQKSSTSDNLERISANLELEGCFHLNKITEMSISGIAVSVDGLIILCDRGKPQLVVSSETGEKEAHVRLEDKPFEIDVIPKTNFVVITCVNYNFILFVNALSRKCINTMEIEGSVKCCIACTKSYILIGGVYKIDILKHYGSKVIPYRTLKINYSIISLTLNENDGIIYFSSLGSNKLHRFNMRGNELLPVETKTPGNTTTRPTTCIRVDVNKSIYYLDSDINNLHILSEEGKYIGSLALENPKAFTFNSDCTQLYIVEEEMGCLDISKFKLD